MSDPITDPQYGSPDWQDFVNNWRAKDAEWLRDRTVQRFASVATRDAAMGASGPGTIVYRADAESGAGGWEGKKQTGGFAPFRGLPQNLAVPTDTGSAVLLAHGGASGLGMSFGTTTVNVNAPTFTVQGGVLTADATGVSVKTGTKTAKFTTNATDLLLDSPLTAPSLTLTGTGTVISAAGKTVAAGTVSADSLSATNLALSGTLTGGVLNGTSGTIGGVALGSNFATASTGYISQAGYFSGDGSNAYVRYRNPSGGAIGSASVVVAQTTVSSNGDHYMNGYLRIMGGRGVPWHNSAGTHVAWLAPVIYSGGDPGAANYPDGTLWIS